MVELSPDGSAIRNSYELAHGEGLHSPSLFWTGDGYGVTFWQNEQLLYFKLGAEAAVPTDPAVLAGAGREVVGQAAVWSRFTEEAGEGLSVTWSQSDVSRQSGPVHLVRFLDDGAVVGREITVTESTSYRDGVSVVADRHGYRLAWVEETEDDLQIYLARAVEECQIVADGIDARQQSWPTAAGPT